MSTKFWYDDITVLYDKKKILEFIPYREFDFNRKLNAIVRLSIYYSIVSYILTYSKNSLCIPFIILIITVFLFKNRKDKGSNHIYSRNTNNENRKKGIDNLVKDENLLNDSIYKNKNVIEGFSLNNSSNSPDTSGSDSGVLNKFDKIIKDINDSCRLPTHDNPFMNLSTYDLSNGDVGNSCKSYNNISVKNMIENKFTDDLFLDSNDLFNRRNSQRQFYTMPNTSSPNKQDEFARWLYDLGPTCKEGNGNCTISSGGHGASPAPT